MKTIKEEKKYSLERKRELGSYPPNESDSGPILLVSGGIHGNEPSGVQAIKEVLLELEQKKPDFNGTLVGIIGNLKALNKGVRFLDSDLNRLFTDTSGNMEISEEKERNELHRFVEKLEKQLSGKGSLYFLDLHTTSSSSVPYASVNKQKISTDFASCLSLPVVMGIEKYIPGHFDHFLTERGHIGCTVEGGQHSDPEAVTLHKRAIYRAMKSCNMTDEILKEPENTSQTSEFYEVVYRMGLEEGDKFEMKPGFKNFTPVAKGDLLAHYKDKPVYSPLTGRLFLPLYQNSGKDGFFVIQKVRTT